MVSWVIQNGRGKTAKVAPLSGHWKLIEHLDPASERQRSHVYSSQQLKSFKVWFDFTSRSVSTVRSELAKLQGEIDKLKEELDELKADCGVEIKLRDLSYEDARSEIIKFFKENDGEKLDASDIQEYLGIDITLAIQICDDLESEGKIKTI
jgi:hypothetical protein